MSTRHSIFYHNNETAGVQIHIYTEVASAKKDDIRLEIEFPHGVVNVPWPEKVFLEEIRSRPENGVEMMPSTNGLLTHPSPYSVTETLDRLESILHSKNITIFARIDYSGEAAKAGLAMPPTQLLIFGNPKGGTPIMLAAPLSAIDLPLKALAWQDTDGKVWLTINDPRYLQSRYGLSDDLLKPIAGLELLIQQAIA